jgi:hypothetical protein
VLDEIQNPSNSELNKDLDWVKNTAAHALMRINPILQRWRHLCDAKPAQDDTSKSLQPLLRPGYEVGNGFLIEGSQLVDGEWFCPSFGSDSLQYVVDSYRYSLAKLQSSLSKSVAFTLDELRAAWNAQSDPANSWDNLGLDEIIEFAQQQLLARFGGSKPQPIPVTERLPGPEDCCGNPRNGQGQWCWGRVRPRTTAGTPVVWRLMRIDCLIEEAEDWLPWWAIPLPAADAGEVQP